jgi:transposase
MPAKYVRPYSKGQKNDFRDAEAIAEAVQRPTMKFVTTKTTGESEIYDLIAMPLLVVVPRESSCRACAFRASQNSLP